MKILLLEPFWGGSHQQWAEGYQRHSRHEIQFLSLPGRHWKWRMHGAAVTLAGQFLQNPVRADLILATDMLDLSLFLSLTRSHTANIPTALYFHENQFSYPWSPNDQDTRLQRDHHYPFLNYTSALCASAVFFNSAYNRNTFLSGLETLLNSLPDFQEKQNMNLLSSKSKVLPLGLDLAFFNNGDLRKENATPLILWNHRWEHDKGPEEFFEGLVQLSQSRHRFHLAVLGERFQKVPACFDRAKERLHPHIVQWGYAASRGDYRDWLWKADYLPVTAKQDFFGASVVEAMAAGVRPLLPDRLAYPEHVPESWRTSVLYRESEWAIRLGEMLNSKPESIPSSDWVLQYDWSRMAPIYDDMFEGLPLQDA